MNKAKIKQQRIEITSLNPEVLLACYGTLRLYEPNYNRLLKGCSEYLGTFETDPIFTMTTRGGFPIVYSNGNTAITYDLFKIENNDVLQRIHSLEGCTGIPGDDRNWYDIVEIGKNTYMYVQHGEFDKNLVIESGNWLERDGLFLL